MCECVCIIFCLNKLLMLLVSIFYTHTQKCFLVVAVLCLTQLPLLKFSLLISLDYGRKSNFGISISPGKRMASRCKVLVLFLSGWCWETQSQGQLYSCLQQPHWAYWKVLLVLLRFIFICQILVLCNLWLTDTWQIYKNYFEHIGRY